MTESESHYHCFFTFMVSTLALFISKYFLNTGIQYNVGLKSKS